MVKTLRIGSAVAELIPHEGIALLEHNAKSSRWTLVHSMTFERKALREPRGAWQLDFMPSGHGYIYMSESSQDPILLSKLFVNSVYSTPDGRMHVDGPDGVGRQMTRELAEFREEVRYATLEFDASELDTYQFELAVFTQPRQGCKLAWDIHSMYKTIGLVSGDNSTNFLYRSFSRWSKFLDDLGFEAALQRSRPTVMKDTATDGLGADIGKNLDFPTLRTDALLVFLIRWSQFAPSHGGLSYDNDQEKTFRFFGLLMEMMPERFRHVLVCTNTRRTHMPAKFHVKVAYTAALCVRTGLINLAPVRHLSPSIFD